jgi:hypothetical protein
VVFTSAQLAAAILQVDGRALEGGVVQIPPNARLLLDVLVNGSGSGETPTESEVATFINTPTSGVNGAVRDLIASEDANAASAVRVQQDARLSATYAPRNDIILASKYATPQEAVDAAAARATGSVTLGTTILLPIGTTNLPATLVFNQQALTLRGQGPGSILKWTGPAGAPMIQVLDSARIVIEDMTILGDATNIPSAGIYFEAPTVPTVGTNELCHVRRVSFGRKHTTDTVGGAPMQYGIRVGGAANGNNDQFAFEDVQVHDATVAGIAISNTQSIWGQIKNAFLNQCAIGLLSNANVEGSNLQFNRCGIDLKITQGRTNIVGFYSEHTGLLWDQSTTSSLSIHGGKALVESTGTELTDATKWANSLVAARNQLALRDFFVDRATGTAKLFISGSSSDTQPAHVYIRGCNLPDGDTDAGYTINGYGAGTPLHVDIQQGTYWRRQVVQTLAAASEFTPVSARTVLGPWFRENVAAGLTNVSLAIPGMSIRTTMPMSRAGAITGIAVDTNIARTAGTLTVEVLRNGSGVGLTAVLDATNTIKHQRTQAATGTGSDPFVAGDTIGVRVTTSADWAPTNASIVVSVEIVT